MSEPTLAKVVMIRKDGSTLTLEGEAVIAWERACMGAVTMAMVHGAAPFAGVFELPGITRTPPTSKTHMCAHAACRRQTELPESVCDRCDSMRVDICGNCALAVVEKVP
jgi:hypothetical protein